MAKEEEKGKAREEESWGGIKANLEDEEGVE